MSSCFCCQDWLKERWAAVQIILWFQVKVSKVSSCLQLSRSGILSILQLIFYNFLAKYLLTSDTVCRWRGCLMEELMEWTGTTAEREEDPAPEPGHLLATLSMTRETWSLLPWVPGHHLPNHREELPFLTPSWLPAPWVPPSSTLPTTETSTRGLVSADLSHPWSHHQPASHQEGLASQIFPPLAAETHTTPSSVLTVTEIVTSTSWVLDPPPSHLALITREKGHHTPASSDPHPRTSLTSSLARWPRTRPQRRETLLEKEDDILKMTRTGTEDAAMIMWRWSEDHQNHDPEHSPETSPGSHWADCPRPAETAPDQTSPRRVSLSHQLINMTERVYCKLIFKFNIELSVIQCLHYFRSTNNGPRTETELGEIWGSATYHRAGQVRVAGSGSSWRLHCPTDCSPGYPRQWPGQDCSTGSGPCSCQWWSYFRNRWVTFWSRVFSFNKLSFPQEPNWNAHSARELTVTRQTWELTSDNDTKESGSRVPTVTAPSPGTTRCGDTSPGSTDTTSTPSWYQPSSGASRCYLINLSKNIWACPVNKSTTWFTRVRWDPRSCDQHQLNNSCSRPLNLNHDPWTVADLPAQAGHSAHHTTDWSESTKPPPCNDTVLDTTAAAAADLPLSELRLAETSGVASSNT